MIQDNNKIISKNELIISSVIWIFILFIGGILLYLGFNESFYVENGTIRGIFEIVTEMGSEDIFIILLAFVFFATDKDFSRKLLTVFFISLYFNVFVKYFINDPRPAWNIDLETLEPIETSPGFPSGHTQSSVAYWGNVYFNAERIEKKNIIQIICIILLILVPVSRVIMGVHDLQDVIGGYVIGIIILQLYMIINPKLQGLKEKKIGMKIGLGVMVSFAIWLVALLVSPTIAEEVSQASGLLLAMAIGFPLCDEKIKFNPKDFDNKNKIISGILGVVITMVFFIGLGVLFGMFPDSISYIMRFVKYIILGLVITLLAPILIKKILKIE